MPSSSWYGVAPVAFQTLSTARAATSTTSTARSRLRPDHLPAPGRRSRGRAAGSVSAVAVSCVAVVGVVATEVVMGFWVAVVAGLMR